MNKFVLCAVNLFLITILIYVSVKYKFNFRNKYTKSGTKILSSPFHEIISRIIARMLKSSETSTIFILLMLLKNKKKFMQIKYVVRKNVTDPSTDFVPNPVSNLYLL